MYIGMYVHRIGMYIGVYVRMQDSGSDPFHAEQRAVSPSD